MRRGLLYFIRPVGAEGPVKVGYSAAPRSRLLNMMQWSPVELELILAVPAGPKDEFRAHRYFAETWIRHEWFAWSPRIAQVIDALRTGTAPDQAIPHTATARPRPKTQYTPVIREKFSYAQRLWRAERRSGCVIDGPAYKEWKSISYLDRQGLALPDAVKREVDAFVADPLKHGKPWPCKSSEAA